jgi:hypothetical protein
MMREDALTVHVPMTFSRRGGRKLIVAPGGTAMPSIVPRFHVDNVLVKALARAFRWQSLLDQGHYLSIKDIAAQERIDPSYVGDVLRLTLLAPDIVEMILDGRQPRGLQLEQLRKSLPLDWAIQRDAIRGAPTGWLPLAVCAEVTAEGPPIAAEPVRSSNRQ